MTDQMKALSMSAGDFFDEDLEFDGDLEFADDSDFDEELCFWWSGDVVRDGRFPCPGGVVTIDQPYCLGKYLGEEWARTASREAILEAADRATTKKQIVRYFAHDRDIIDLSEFSEDHEWFPIPPLHEGKGCGHEIKAHFDAVMKEYPALKGIADASDSEIRMGTYVIPGMPVAAFRLYEEGWTHAVREHRATYYPALWMYPGYAKIIPSSPGNQHINDPFAFGRKCGSAWARTVSLKEINEAANHETTKEQLNMHFTEDCHLSDEAAIGVSVFPPNNASDWRDETTKYFRSVLALFPNYQGVADPHTDSEICLDGTFLPNMPVASFRLFEDGWTHAVRKHRDRMRSRRKGTKK